MKPEITRHLQVLHFISTIRDSFRILEYVYTSGGCYQFHLILRSVFPEAVPYHDGNHVITRIGGFFYDITGRVRPNEHHSDMRRQMAIRKAHRWHYDLDNKLMEIRWMINP